MIYSNIAHQDNANGGRTIRGMATGDVGESIGFISKENPCGVAVQSGTRRAYRFYRTLWVQKIGR